MIELGSVSEIVSGFNVARLPINERDRRYTNADFEYDFHRMKLADPSNSSRSPCRERELKNPLQDK